jgi:hypothetical protein
MQVTFTRSGERRHHPAIGGAIGPRPTGRQGSGSDKRRPDDSFRFAVAEAVRGAAFARGAAAWRSGVLWPAETVDVRLDRGLRRPTPGQRERMIRSEMIAVVGLAPWQPRAGRLPKPPSWCAGLTPEQLRAPLLARICDRLDRVAPRWHVLQGGSEITLTWSFPEANRRTQTPRHAARDIPRARRWSTGAAARRG